MFAKPVTIIHGQHSADPCRNRTKGSFLGFAAVGGWQQRTELPIGPTEVDCLRVDATGSEAE